MPPANVPYRPAYPFSLEEPAPSQAVTDVLAEGPRQIAAGYDAAHDDSHTKGEIISAPWGALGRLSAAARAAVRVDFPAPAIRTLLVESAALIIAEIERLDRKTSQEKNDGTR